MRCSLYGADLVFDNLLGYAYDSGCDVEILGRYCQLYTLCSLGFSSIFQGNTPSQHHVIQNQRYASNFTRMNQAEEVVAKVMSVVDSPEHFYEHTYLACRRCVCLSLLYVCVFCHSSLFLHNSDSVGSVQEICQT